MAGGKVGGRRAAGRGASRSREADGARHITHLGIEFLDGRVREGGVAQAAAGLGDGLQGLGTCASFEKGCRQQRTRRNGTHRRRVRGDAGRARSLKAVERGTIDRAEARDASWTARTPRAPPRARERYGLTSRQISWRGVPFFLSAARTTKARRAAGRAAAAARTLAAPGATRAFAERNAEEWVTADMSCLVSSRLPTRALARRS